MTSTLLAIGAAAALAASSAVPARRVAVLDFQASWAGECVAGAKLGQTQREQCEILRLFADKARMGALTVLRPPGFVVMTRENTAQILKDMGGQCTEGECEVETARLLGASIVLSGEVTFMEGTWIVSLKVHDVATAALLGGADTRGKTKLEAFDNVRAETEKMLHASAVLEGTAAPPPPPPPKRVEPVVVPVPVVSKDPAIAVTLPASTEPGKRRWSVEGRFGFSVLGMVSVSPQDAKPFGLVGMEVSGGYRVADAWSLYGTLSFFPEVYGQHDYAGQHNDSLYFGEKRLVAGAAWAPMGNRYFSIGAELGAALVTARAEMGYPVTVDKKDEKTAFSWGLELRADYPLGEAWYLGARLAGKGAIASFDLTATEGTHTFKVQDGLALNGGSIAVGYRF